MLSELQNGQFWTHSNYLFSIYDICIQQLLCTHGTEFSKIMANSFRLLTSIHKW